MDHNDVLDFEHGWVKEFTRKQIFTRISVRRKENGRHLGKEAYCYKCRAVATAAQIWEGRGTLIEFAWDFADWLFAV
jgi:hypothetical protein